MRSSIKQLVHVIIKLNYVLENRHRRRAIGVFIVIMISSCFELLGVTAILPFMQAIMTPDLLMQNSIIRLFMQLLSIQSANGLLVLMGIALVILYIVKNAFMVFSQFVQADYGTRMQKELSTKMLNSYMRRPYTYFVNTNSAEILRGCVDDISSVYTILSYVWTVLAESLSVIMIGIFLIFTDPFIALGTLFIMSLVLLGIVIIFKPTVKRAGKERISAVTQKNKTIYQSVAGIKEIMVKQRKGFFVGEYEKASEKARKAERIYETLSNAPDRIVEGICVGGIVGIVCVRLSFGTSDTTLFVPLLGTFAMAAFKILPSIGKLASRMNGIMYYMPGLDNAYSNMLEAEKYNNKRTEGNKSLEEKNEQLLRFSNEINIKHICWQYENAKEPVLKDVNFNVYKGQSVALIGASGAGKTTLADVLLGLLPPQSGAIEMDGVDVYTIPLTWAHTVGYVPQSVFLMDATIRDNVAFGLHEKQISEDRIWNALERAQLSDYIKSLPNGLDTIVGERGVKLSGGQKQRISIARALYNEPQILVLDEATAALDNETETDVMEAIEALQGQITMIIIAHRLTTIRNCDKIYEIRDGVAIERSKRDVLGCDE